MNESNRLVLISGPSNAGKSTLIKRMLDGKYPKICTQLEISDFSKWEIVQGNRLTELGPEYVPNLIVHKTIRSTRNGNSTYNTLREVINNSAHVSIVTIAIPNQVLLQRNQYRLLKRKILNICRIRKLPLSSNMLDRNKHFQDPNSVLDAYTEWFQFAGSITPDNSWLYESSNRRNDQLVPFTFEDFFRMTDYSFLQQAEKEFPT